MRFDARLVWRCSCVLALSVGLSALAGCKGSAPKKSFGPTVPVKGKVTYNGKAVPAGCTITFFHQEGNFPATGTIEADGAYTLLFNGKPGAPTGTYKVSVSPPAGTQADTAVPDPSNPEAYKAFMMKKGIAKGAGSSKPAFPSKYATAETSKVTFTVVEGQTTYDLDMKD